MSTALAIRWHGNGKLILDEVEVKPLLNGQVRLHPKFVGICGSDVGEWLHPVSVYAAYLTIESSPLEAFSWRLRAMFYGP